MGSKITRRTVLGGTVAVLAAFPFVMSFSRDRKQVEYPFAREWEQGLAEAHAVIKKAARESVELLSPPSYVMPRQTNYVNIIGFYGDTAFPDATPVSDTELAAAVPDRFLYRKGSLVSDEKGSLLSGTLLASRLIAPNSKQESPAKKWQIGTKQLIQGNVPQDERESVPLGVCIELPDRKTMKVGDEWQGANSFAAARNLSLNYRVADFVTVGGVDTVKAEFHFSTDDSSFLRSEIDKEKMAANFRSKGYSPEEAESIASQLAEELTKEISKTEVKSTFEGIVYIDYKTGYALRHQLHIITDSQSGVQHSVGIYQVS